jgi:Na+-driven multidrug efflux pump
MLVILACFETTLLLCINHPLLNALSAPIKHTDNETLNAYYQKVHDLQIKIASQITIGYSAGLIIPMFMVYFASLIKAEGRFKFVAVVTVCTNLLNIGLTTLLVIVAKMNAYSAPISTVTSQGLNLIILISFLFHINKNNKT